MIITQEQVEFLNECTRRKWSINPQTGLVDVDGDFNCSYIGLEDFKGVRFGSVSGSFYCYRNNLKTLEGTPAEVGGDFYSSYNRLETLEGAPTKVGGDFYCNDNQLKTLEGAPTEVGGSFSCNNNRLETLEGAPAEVGGDFYCSHNRLETLEGAPAEVGEGFYCDAFNTPNWTLEGQLEIMKTGSPESKTLISTIISPEAIQKRIDKDTSKAAVELKGIWKTLKGIPGYEGLKFPEGHSEEADLLADLDGIGL